MGEPTFKVYNKENPPTALLEGRENSERQTRLTSIPSAPQKQESRREATSGLVIGRDSWGRVSVGGERLPSHACGGTSGYPHEDGKSPSSFCLWREISRQQEEKKSLSYGKALTMEIHWTTDWDVDYVTELADNDQQMCERRELRMLVQRNAVS
ncbi:hypothetical protein AAFF_G00173630 [Aldrovandia affinis]|uniref:Uncharacterized protein n=1 Tax=Aldrovandia affinis TaxID=143900 RepID=A0AAD7WW18_9TELE|nr:hypothetical protein AAFF_G00173630 [Aldrovandia affinis]